MKIETKAQILSDLYVVARDRDEWQQFFRYADLGVPASILFMAGYCTMTPELEELISDTFSVLLKVLDVTGDFDSLDDLLEKVANNG